MDEIDAINVLLYQGTPNLTAEEVGRARELAIKALEKQIPQKPIEDGYYDEPCVCPNCGNPIINDADVDYAVKYCYLCGQKIDWSKISNEAD